MNDEELSQLNAIPGSAIMGMEVIGLPVASTSGFWFEVDKEQSDWVDVDVRPVYTRYNNNI